jgi:hypothetical protein
MKVMDTTTDNTNTSDIAAETDAVMDHLLSGKPVAEEILKRIEERGKRIRQEILERHGVLNVAVELVRETRDEE